MVIILILGVTFLVFLLFGLAVASFSTEQYMDDYKKLSKKPVRIFRDAEDFIKEISDEHLLHPIKVGKSPYGDYYLQGHIYLKEETLCDLSLASVTIISHEMGHAKQDQTSNNIKKLNKIRVLGRFLGKFLSLFLLVGIIVIALYYFEVLNEIAWFYVAIGLLSASFLIFLYALFEKFQEIRIEKEASLFAMEFLKSYLNEEELSLCKELLDSARLTYWADFFKAMFGIFMLTNKTKLFR